MINENRFLKVFHLIRINFAIWIVENCEKVEPLDIVPFFGRYSNLNSNKILSKEIILNINSYKKETIRDYN